MSGSPRLELTLLSLFLKMEIKSKFYSQWVLEVKTDSESKNLTFLSSIRSGNSMLLEMLSSVKRKNSQVLTCLAYQKTFKSLLST